MRISCSNCRGESLIEVLAAVVVAAVLLGGLSIILLSSLRNAQFAQSQVKATKYAQEAVDQIRALRDRNENIVLNGRPLSFAEFLRSGLPTGTANCGSTSCFFTLTGSGGSLSLEGAGASSFAETGDANLTRQIYFENNFAGKKLTVIVRWLDNAGPHESNLQTILTER